MNPIVNTMVLESKSKARKTSLFKRQRSILEQLGENIKLARMRRRFSATLISERTGLSRTTINKIEAGNEGVSIGNYLIVLTAVGLGKDLANVGKDDELGRKLQDIKTLGRDL